MRIESAQLPASWQTENKKLDLAGEEGLRPCLEQGKTASDEYMDLTPGNRLHPGKRGALASKDRQRRYAQQAC